MINRRDKRLDSLLDSLVDVTFTDGDTKTGVLQYNMQPTLDRLPIRKYCLYVFGTGRIFFYKSAVRRIREHKC